MASPIADAAFGLLPASIRAESQPLVGNLCPNSRAPAFDVMVSPSNCATMARRSTASNSNSFGVHSVGIGDLRESRKVVAAQQLSLIRGPDALNCLRKDG